MSPAIDLDILISRLRRLRAELERPAHLENNLNALEKFSSQVGSGQSEEIRPKRGRRKKNLIFFLLIFDFN